MESTTRMVTSDAQLKVRREIAGMLVFVAIGVVVEVFVTGLPRPNQRSSGLGQVSVLMAVLYGTVYLASPWLFDALDSLALENRFLRALATVVLIYAFEWSYREPRDPCGRGRAHERRYLSTSSPRLIRLVVSK